MDYTRISIRQIHYCGHYTLDFPAELIQLLETRQFIVEERQYKLEQRLQEIEKKLNKKRDV